MLESLVSVINVKRLSNVIKEWDTTLISWDSLHAIAVGSYGFLFNCTTLGQASDLIMVLA